MGFPGGPSGKDPACQYRTCRMDKEQGSTTQHRELYLISCNKRKYWKRKK